MKTTTKLLVPAADFKAFHTVLEWGIDAVYVGLKGFSRYPPEYGFDMKMLEKAATEARSHGIELHVALNAVFTGETERKKVLKYGEKMAEFGITRLIINDPGITGLLRKNIPSIPITASIGFGVTNTFDAHFLSSLGISSIVLPENLQARELSELVSKLPPGMETEMLIGEDKEAFVGGRCYLSSYFSSCMETGLKRKSCSRLCKTEWKPFRLLKNEDHLSRAIFSFRTAIETGITYAKLYGRTTPLHRLEILVKHLKSVLNEMR